jgi:putative transcriptional regulator
VKIYCKLKVIFAERNIRGKEFSGKVGITHTTLSSLINNKSLPTMPVAYKIAVELDMNVMEIWRVAEK